MWPLYNMVHWFDESSNLTWYVSTSVKGTAQNITVFFFQKHRKHRKKQRSQRGKLSRAISQILVLGWIGMNIEAGVRLYVLCVS